MDFLYALKLGAWRCAGGSESMFVWRPPLAGIGGLRLRVLGHEGLLNCIEIASR